MTNILDFQCDVSCKIRKSLGVKVQLFRAINVEGMPLNARHLSWETGGVRAEFTERVGALIVSVGRTRGDILRGLEEAQISVTPAHRQYIAIFRDKFGFLITLLEKFKVSEHFLC